MTTMNPGDSVELSDELATYVEELEDARVAKKAAEQREKDARNVLVEALKLAQASEGLTASGRGVRLQIQHRRTVNSSMLEALHPEIYESVLKESDVEVLRLV